MKEKTPELAAPMKMPVWLIILPGVAMITHMTYVRKSRPDSKTVKPR